MTVNVLTHNTRDIVAKVGLKHIAIIMDGNRRWASQKKLPGVAGHKEGVQALKRTVRAASGLNIKYLTVYAFSTENWNRKKEEVDFLMFLLKESIKNELRELHENNVKIIVIGDRTPLNDELKQVIKDIEELTGDNTGLNLHIAINYGARDEITKAVKSIAYEVRQGKLDPEDITIDSISKKLYTQNVPDPDLLIRTGGEQRVSNYLLWQIAYTEFYVTEKFWPEFDIEALEESILAFEKRNRRFGGD